MFQTSANIESIATRVDNTIKIVIGTQELEAEQAVELFKLKGKQGWVLFKENPLEQKDIPPEPAPEFKNDKSPSARLRATLYVWWEQNTGKQKTFDAFYKEWIETKITQIKETLK